jgi:hypothetical protein
MNLRYTLRNELFLLHDSGFLDTKRILIFSTSKNLEALKNCEMINVDGTFRSIPKGFYQLLSIFGFVYGRAYPLAYCIISDKSFETYSKIFKFFKEHYEIQPKFIMTDFEIGLINSLKQIFPVAENKTCIFHFSQCIWRNVQLHNLTSMYKNNFNFKKHIHSVLNLAFLKKDDIKKRYLVLKDRIFKNFERNSNITDFLNYFEQSYIGNDEDIF